MAGSLILSPIGIGPGEDGAARIELEARIRPGVNDLGDLVVHTPELLASGLCVDDLGAPLAGALLGVRVPDTAGAADVWRTEPHLGGPSDAAGRFELRGVARPERLRIRASSRNHVQLELVEAPRGVRDLLVKLSRTSTITGRVLRDEAVRAAKLGVEVRLPHSLRLTSLPAILQRLVRADGSFELQGLPPVRIDLLLRAPDTREPLLTIQGLELAPGETCADPRLRAIDLRGVAWPTPPAPVPAPGARRE